MFVLRFGCCRSSWFLFIFAVSERLRTFGNGFMIGGVCSTSSPYPPPIPPLSLLLYCTSDYAPDAPLSLSSLSPPFVLSPYHLPVPSHLFCTPLLPPSVCSPSLTVSRMYRLRRIFNQILFCRTIAISNQLPFRPSMLQRIVVVTRRGNLHTFGCVGSLQKS